MESRPTIPSTQGYSDFFTSGLRAMTSRVRVRRAKRNTIDAVGNQNRSSFWTDEYFDLDNTAAMSSNNPFTRRRHASMIVDSHAGKKGQDTTPKKKRRSALMTFSARLLSRMSSTSVEEPSPPLPIPPSFSDGECGDELTSANSGPASGERPSLHPIDPFSSWSDVGSTYSGSHSNLSRLKVEEKRQSFLSLNSTPSNRSSLIYPPVIRESSNSTSITTQSIAPSPVLPSQFNRSSLPWNPEEAEDADDEGVEMSSDHSPISDDQESYDCDAPARVDWRQFHIDLLQIIANDNIHDNFY